MQSHIKNSLANDQAAEFDEALLTYGDAFANVIQTVQACERYAFLNLVDHCPGLTPAAAEWLRNEVIMFGAEPTDGGKTEETAP